jgi:hypothetical protein
MDCSCDSCLSKQERPLRWWVLFGLDAFLVGCLVAAIWWAVK